MDGTSILGAMQALQFGASTVNGLLTLKVGAEVQTKAIELNTQIIAAQGHIMAIQKEFTEAIDEIKSLKDEVNRLKSIGDKKEQYQLYNVSSGAFVYVLKAEAEGQEAPHWLCVNCFETGFRSLLQFKQRVNGNRESVHACPKCKNTITTHWGAKPKLLSEIEVNKAK